MTTLVQSEQIWTSRPGWGIVADLTPPELVASRRRQSVQKGMAAAVVALFVACGAGYAVEFTRHSSAQDALAAAQDRASFLQAQQGSFVDVNQIDAKIAQYDKQVATVMTGDVDVNALVVVLRSSLPATMTIKTASVVLAVGTAHNPSTAATDTAGHRIIGSVILGGSASAYDDVAHYVDTLVATRGIVDVLPTSAQADKTGVQYNLTFNLTDALLSHRFDLSKIGGK